MSKREFKAPTVSDRFTLPGAVFVRGDGGGFFMHASDIPELIAKLQQYAPKPEPSDNIMGSGLKARRK